MDNCEWCGTRLFEKDRNCPSCGGTIKFVYQEEELFPKNKFYMDSDFPYQNAIALAVNNVPETVMVGDYLTLRVFCIEKEGAPYIVTLSDLDIFSSNKKVAIIEKEGLIRFAGKGKVKITGNISGKPFMDFKCETTVV